METTEDKRPKLLIVEDNKQNIELLMDLFREDYRLTAAINPQRALKLAASDSPPDLILLDILLPEMDGYEVCRHLKNDERTRNIPVVFVTAVSEVMDAAKGFDLGAVDYITKPFHPPIIKARVKLHLELKRQKELLEEYAFLDALTEVPNRRKFDQVLLKEWHRALRSEQRLSILFWDIDHFKEYNDAYGHGQGDHCLRQMALTASQSLQRAGDFMARYGGEEFAAILPYTDAQQALEVARHLTQALEDLAIPHQSSPVADIVTVSMGVATAQPNEGARVEELVEKVDQALYAAKRAGRRRIETVSV